MSGDPLSTLGPSDSGFLNSFLTPNPSTPLRSRVGEDSVEDATRSDAARPDAARSDTVQADSLAGSDSVLTPDPVEEAAAEPTPSDSQLDRMLQAAPLPEGLVARLHERLDGWE